MCRNNREFAHSATRSVSGAISAPRTENSSIPRSHSFRRTLFSSIPLPTRPHMTSPYRELIVLYRSFAAGGVVADRFEMGPEETKPGRPVFPSDSAGLGFLQIGPWRKSGCHSTPRFRGSRLIAIPSFVSLLPRVLSLDCRLFDPPLFSRLEPIRTLAR